MNKTPKGRRGGGPAEEPRFLCLCMSPAVDATATLAAAPRGEGEIHADASVVENVGGKAVNVARWLALRGASVACGGLLGEENARPFADELARYGVADRFVRVPGATRRNETVAWPGGSFKINQAAFPALAGSAEWKDGTLAARVLGSLAPEGGRGVRGARRVAVLSGSLPRGCPATFYADAVARFRAAGFAVVLDASGEAMARGIEAGPDLVKPNAEECEALVGFVPRTPDEFRRATRKLREKAAHAIISDGGAGAWFDGAFVPAPHVAVVDPTAAGDTLLAEYCYRLFARRERGAAGAAAAPRWAVAAGSAACTMPGGSPPAAEVVARLFRRTAEGAVRGTEGARGAGAAGSRGRRSRTIAVRLGR